jgi:glycerol uptake facilitator-like aquaporin
LAGSFVSLSSGKTPFPSFCQGILIEFFATIVLVTVILMVALDSKSKTGLAPLIIGFTLAVCILAM